ncbi:MAG: hypothetical protein IPG51_17495 [Chloroflexi bacterium]|nr:hypothetical protein [Chloroflexota bacterium]
MLLINQEGRTLEQYTAIDTTGLTRLVDINHDAQSEVLLARFATVELLGLGGGSAIANEWNYSSLFAAPSAVLVYDFDQDGNDEILIGARDAVCTGWITMAHYAGLPNRAGLFSPGCGARRQQRRYAAHRCDPQRQPAGPEQPGKVEGVIELRQTNGDEVWQREIPAEVTAVLVAQLQGDTTPEIIVGTVDSHIYIYDTTGELLWTAVIDDQINQFLVQSNRTLHVPELLVVSQNLIYRVRNGQNPAVITAYPAVITHAYQTTLPQVETETTLVTWPKTPQSAGSIGAASNCRSGPFTSTDGRLSACPSKPPETDADQNPTATENAFLIATDANTLLHLTLDTDTPLITWQIPDLPAITSLHWGDLDGDAQPDRGGRS